MRTSRPGIVRPRHAILLAAALAGLAACAHRTSRAGATPAIEPLLLWTAAADTTHPDFLAVLDVREREGRYGRLVATVPVPGHGHRPHHTEHTLAPDGRFFANGFRTGQSFVFDVRDPAAPRLAARFGDVGALAHPHSFWRMADGNVLATFQMRHEGGTMRPGGLAVLDPDGRPLRTASADGPGVHPAIRPYSAAIVPAFDRIVTTTHDMDDRDTTRFVQVWRLSDLTLLHTIALPDGPRGDEAFRTAEPRLLDDGRTVLVSTFNCGLYRLDQLDGPAPRARFVTSFPRRERTACAVPVVTGNHYLATVPAWSAVVSLDITDLAAPREVSRITLGPDDVPHWLGLSPDGRRVVITGYRALATRILLARFDPATGRLALDERFRAEGRDEPGFRFEGIAWPHGGTYDGVPHGAVFGPRRP
jgi:hypothetical protein